MNLPRIQASLAVYGLYMCLPLFAPSAQASFLSECVRALLGKTAAPVVQTLPPIYELDLPKEALEEIAHHPIQESKAYFSETNLTIDVSHVLLPDKYGELQYNVASGEGIQGIFVLHTLRQIFPQAKFKHLDLPWLQDDGHKITALRIPIGDRAEWDEKLPTTHLEMSDLKGANPLYGSIDREQTRKKFGIMPHVKVLHIYATNYRGSVTRDLPHSDSLPAILAQINAGNFGFDVIILSVSGATEVYEIASPDRQGLSGRWHNLSNLTPDDFARIKPGSTTPYMVFNDTAGKMPFLHAVSDMTVVRGPINFFEPLSVGTRTVSLHNTEIHGYSWKVFMEMVKKARKVPYFEFVYETSHLAEAMRSLLQIEPGPRYQPQLLKDEKGNSPFTNYLDKLKRLLDSYRDNALKRGSIKDSEAP